MIRIGTRNSALALWQAQQVKNQLQALGVSAELIPVESEGDQNLRDPLYKMGIQGIFTKTLDAALLDQRIDIAVHSLKDVPTVLAEGIEIKAVLARGACADVLVYPPEHNTPPKKIIGTGSLRRKAQWLRKNPDYTVENLRGNVQKRLEKLAQSEWTGAIFAQAGIERLELSDLHYNKLDWMIPAPAQGAIGIASLSSNSAVLPFLDRLNSSETALCTEIERSFLNTLEGGCTAPIGAIAKIKGSKLFFQGGLFSLDGSQAKQIEEVVSLQDAKGLGIQSAKKILDQGGASLMDEIKSQLSK